jgi:hypothetical protein
MDTGARQHTSSVRTALIIANARYADPKLQGLRAPVDDAQALADVLSDSRIGDFEVELLVDQNEPTIRRRVAAFFANRNPEDTLLLHFSCHGLKDDNGDLYFAASDTEITSLDATGLPAEFVHRQMTKSRSRRIVLLLDCCYSGAFGEGLTRRADSSIDLEGRFEGRGRTVLTASSAMEYAFEGRALTVDEGTPSIFTGAVVDGLRTGAADLGGDGYVSVEELYDYVYREVKVHTPSQTPRRWSFDIEGEVIIAKSPGRPSADLPAEVTAAVESPFRDIRLVGVAELQRLLLGRHLGHAMSARLALESMLDDDSNLVRNAAEQALATLDSDAHGFDGPRGPSPSKIERPITPNAGDTWVEPAQVEPLEVHPARVESGSLAPVPADPLQIPRSKENFDFLSAEFPTTFDTVWDCAVTIDKWPKFPTPALRQACVLVTRGHSADEAVSTSFK